ncbi:hypothetical protein [Opitutus sp. ER46]|uniref:hypothetical protein n=1 Tax=Opitutus sp. ER46 TaxID=2161864 RepID=UPI000D2FB1A3|nr:hypothetical protein [Opitutus sp. ER46]PTX94261.1 hypothetical protein DB354_10885 [Opitutus sp. ER46]
MEVPAERYLFTRGESYANDSDNGVRSFDFDTLTQEVATAMGTTRFERLTSRRRSALVLAVHWGLISPEQSAGAEAGMDMDSIRQADEAVESAQATEKGDLSARVAGVAAAAEGSRRAAMSQLGGINRQDMAQVMRRQDMLGLRGAVLPPPAPGDAPFTLADLMNEPRYFVAVLAFDPRAGVVGRPTPVWTVQMTINARGRDFAAALKEMCAVAGPYFGTNQPTLVVKTVGEKRAEELNAEGLKR